MSAALRRPLGSSRHCVMRGQALQARRVEGADGEWGSAKPLLPRMGQRIFGMSPAAAMANDLCLSSGCVLFGLHYSRRAKQSLAVSDDNRQPPPPPPKKRVNLSRHSCLNKGN